MESGRLFRRGCRDAASLESLVRPSVCVRVSLCVCLFFYRVMDLFFTKYLLDWCLCVCFMLIVCLNVTVWSSEAFSYLVFVNVSLRWVVGVCIGA